MRKALAIITLFLSISIIPAPKIFAQKKFENKISSYNESPSDPFVQNINPQISTPYKFRKSNLARMNSNLIFTTQVNVNVNGLNILNDAANEPSITVNPVNPNEMAIGWRQFDNVVSNFRQAGYAYSSDAGHTWTFPGTIEPGVFHSDPVLDYDNAGNFYYNSLRSTTAGFPCLVYKSTDGGASWNNGVSIGGGDKQWMAVDHTTGSGSGNIYSAWTAATSFCPPGFFTRSSDGANSFDSCVVMEGAPAWGTETVGNDGEVYVAGMDSIGNMIVSKSSDAYLNGVITFDFAPVFLDGYLSYGVSVNPGGLLGQANIDVDRSGGPGYGNVYVVAPVTRFSNQDEGDIMFSKSTDGGTIWSPAVKINDDAGFDIQWFGTMSVAPNGRIDVIWLDTRDHPGSDSSALYYSYSIDQGDTWSVNEKMSDSFDPHVGYPNQQKMGDYFDMSSDSTGAHLAWTNTLNGEEDVYYSYIIPDINTGQGELQNEISFSIFPNPASGSFTIMGEFNDAGVEIINMLGENVFSGMLNNFRTTIDVSNYGYGIYVVKVIEGNGEVGVQRIVVK